MHCGANAAQDSALTRFSPIDPRISKVSFSLAADCVELRWSRIGLHEGYKKFDGTPDKLDKQALHEIYAMEVL